MITEDYVSFETAKLLKEKGFDIPCFAYYYVMPHKTVIAYNTDFPMDSKDTHCKICATKLCCFCSYNKRNNYDLLY